MTRPGAAQRLGWVLVAAALAGCGGEDEPVRPVIATSVTVGTDGVSASTGVAVRKGPFTLGLSL